MHCDESVKRARTGPHGRTGCRTVGRTEERAGRHANGRTGGLTDKRYNKVCHYIAEYGISYYATISHGTARVEQMRRYDDATLVGWHSPTTFTKVRTRHGDSFDDTIRYDTMQYHTARQDAMPPMWRTALCGPRRRPHRRAGVRPEYWQGGRAGRRDGLSGG